MNSVWNMIIKDMRILRYILATLAVLATFTACREEDELKSKRKVNPKKLRSKKKFKKQRKKRIKRK